MSLENADQSQLESPPQNPSENLPELNKKPKITYAREILLSFSELELCKKVLEDIDPSLLSELQETAGNKYGSSTYPKAGRWETRSTGSSDKDSDSQTEREIFAPERKYGQYKARSWQPAGQDGLLGKPSGFVPGTSPNRTATYQLNRTSEPYQPPRPYKAAPYGRKDVDSCNDETFGSTEVSVTEEERKRRASFEMMRKEQHKVLQEKQSQKDKEKEQKEKEKMKSDGDDILNLIQGSNESAKIAIPQKEEGLNENLSSSLKSSSSLSRPLVPPGFVPPGFGEKKVQKESEVKSEGAREEKHITTEGFIIDEKKEILMPQNIITGGFILNENNKEISLPQNNNNTNSSSNISILEKFFGSTLSKTSDTSSSCLQIENELAKTEEYLLIPPISSESSSNSKFAHWFTEEDSKPVEDNQSEDLLSIFSKNTPNKEKISKFSPLNSIPMEESIIFDHIISPQTQTLNIIKKDPISNFLSPSNGPVQNTNPNPKPAVLTCEEIEQLMLSQAGINDNINNSNTNINSNNINIPSRRNPNPNWQLGGPTDNSASHHLFSLLTKEKSSEIQPNININTPTNPSININKNPNESVTLEAIFGAAFMNELHSMDAPISSLQENNNNINHNNSLSFPNLAENKREIDNTINLPEEESLFSVNDPPLPLNPNSSLLHQFSNSNSSQTLGLNPFNNTNIPPASQLPPDPHSNLNDPNIILNQRMRQQQFPRQHNQFDFDQGRHLSMHQQQSMRGFDVDSVRHGPNRSRGPGPQGVHQVHVCHHLPHEMVGLQRNFPLHHQQQQQQAGFGGMPGGGNQMQREELERMMQMEMRAKAAQQAARIPPAGYFGPDLDLDFRYR